MCEINAILLRGDKRERIMDSVAKILVEGNSVHLTGILGDKMTVEGSIKEINFSRSEALILANWIFIALLFFSLFFLFSSLFSIIFLFSFLKFLILSSDQIFRHNDKKSRIILNVAFLQDWSLLNISRRINCCGKQKKDGML